MTLTNILPSLRSSLPTQLGSGVWPSTASWDGRGDLVVGGVALSGLAARHGTPTYVLDEAGVRISCREDPDPVGHQVNRFAVYEREVRRLVEFFAAMRARHGIAAAELNLGGGHAVAYSSQDLGFALDAFAGRIRAVVNLEADRHHLPAPRLTVSP